MVMIELVYCKITGKTRSLPKVKINLKDSHLLMKIFRFTISYLLSLGHAKRSRESEDK